MNTMINTVHEEQYSDGSRTLGILINYSTNTNDKFKDSFIYIYREGTYIFFNTIIDMADYLMYADKKILRAYLKEEDFDAYYDSEFIEGKFRDILKWINNQK